MLQTPLLLVVLENTNNLQPPTISEVGNLFCDVEVSYCVIK